MKLPDRYQPEAAALGEGRVVRVLRARDLRAGGLAVAVGVLRPEHAAQPRLRQRFDAEAERTAFIAHPSWMPRYDHDHTPAGIPFVASPVAPGSFARFRAAPPTWDVLLRLLGEVIDGLAWLHARGGVHGNLKPTDLLLVDAAAGAVHARLADPHLGGVLAATLSRRTPPGAPGYAAPEQATDRPEAAARLVDLFALGAVVWEVVTGALPFGSDGTGDTERPLPAFTPRIAVPPRLETVLANLLHPNPLGRYDLVADVRTELLALGPAEPPPGAGRDKSSRTVPREGTVAAPFVAATSFQTDETLDDVSFRGMTSEEVLALAPWNRPLPPAIDVAPPPEPAVDAPAASVAVRAAREVALVGRRQPREALWSAAHTVARERRAGVAVVRGPAGAGRTCLIRSVTTALEQAGHAETVWCTYAADAPDEGIVGAARGLLDPADGGDAERLAARLRARLLRERATGGRTVPTDAAVLLRWCASAEPGAPPSPDGVALNEVLRHLEARSWRGLGLLVLDQAQFARYDAGIGVAERLLDRVRDGGARIPLLVVVSVADEALTADPALGRRVDRMVGNGAAAIQLSAVGPVATEALVVARCPLAPELRARVVRECEGRPWRIVHLLRGWDEAGWLIPGEEWALAPGANPPPFDAATIRARIDRQARRAIHPKRFVDTVHLVALAGPRVPLALVEPLAGPDLHDAVVGCDLWSVQGAVLAFESAELHELVVAEAIDRPDLSYLHRRLGRGWDRVVRDHGLRGGLHAVAAGDAPHAVASLGRAADWAWRAGSVPVLVHAAEIAARVADALPDAASRGTALLWSGRADEALGRFGEAAERFEQARVALEAADDTEHALDAALGVGWCRMRLGEIDAADWLFTEIVDQARQRELLRPEALAMAGRSAIAERKRSFDDAEQGWGRVVSRSARLGDLRFAGEALLGEADLARRLGRYEDAEELYHEAATAYRDGLDPIGELRAQLGLATALRNQRPDEEAEERMLRCLDRAEDHGAELEWTRCWVGLADLSRHRGDADRAHLRYDIAAHWAARTSSFELSVGVSLGRAQLALEAADLGGAYEHTRRAAESLDQRPGHPCWGPYRLVVAALLAERRDHTQTWQWLWSAQEVGVADGVDRDTASCLSRICEVAADAGWGNVLRLAGKLGSEQFERLQDESAAIRLKQRVANALL